MRTQAGFTQVELISTIAAIGILAGVAATGIGNVVEGTREQKLQTELKTLNSALAVYQGAGGQIDDDATITEVISQLKSTVASSMVDQIPGLSSSMVDPRLSFEMQSDSDAKSGSARVVWNASEGRFEIAYSGEGGIATFGLDSDPEAAKNEDSGRSFAFTYSKDSSWVWDFEEASTPASKKPTTINVASTEDDEVENKAPDPSDEEEEPEIELTPLEPPTFSLPAGTYSIRDFDLAVDLSNPNPAGSSDVYYSLDYGDWEIYSGTPVVISSETVLMAQVISRDDATWTSSTVSNSSYTIDPVELLPPTIETSATSFGALDSRFVGVKLEDNNGDDPSYLEYRVAGGPWQTYMDPFVVDRDDYNSAIVIEARAVSDNQYYEASDSEEVAIEYEELTINSAASGRFHSPEGGSGMVTQQDNYEHFAWGEAAGYNYSESELEFAGYQADSAYIGSQFLIGELDYYNGTIYGGTGADSVKFDLSLDMAIGGYTFSDDFTFEFDLINSTNVGNWDGSGQDAWDSADYVKVKDNTMSTEFTIGGVTLEFVLEFGDSTSTGFSEFDEFYVLENRSATTNVYGTVRRVDSSDDYDDVLNSFLGIVSTSDEDEKEHDDNGHGNEEDGYDESNPGASEGVGGGG